MRSNLGFTTMAAIAQRTGLSNSSLLSRLRTLVLGAQRRQHTYAGECKRPHLSGRTSAPPEQQDHYHFESQAQPGTKYVQLQIVNALRLGEREKASRMLLNLGSSNDSFSAEDFAFILDYCARSPDPLFVMETWKVMEEKAVHVNKSCCRYISQAFTRGGYFKEAINWLTYLGENVSVQGVLPMYNIFLKECMSAQSLIDADNCLELMEAQLVGKSEITYWEILKLAVLQRNLAAVCDIWRDYTRYYSPSIIALRKFVWSFTRLRDLESAYSVLQHMVALVNKGNTSLMIASSGRYRSSGIDIPIPLVGELTDWKLGSNNGKCFFDYYGNSVKTKEGPAESSVGFYNGAKQYLCDVDGNLEEDGITATACHVPELPNVYQFIGGKFSNKLEKANQMECSEFSRENMKQQSELRENMKQQSRVSNIARGTTSVPVMNILRWSFNDVLHACAILKYCKLAERLFLQMLELGMKPSKHTYDGVIKAVVYGRGVSYGMEMIELMEKKSIKPSNDTFAALSEGQSKQLDLDIAEDLLERISYGLQKYIHPFNAFFKACDVMDKPERAVHKLAKMKHLRIKPNIRTYELLFSLFGNVNVPYERGNRLSHADVAKRIDTIEVDMMRNGIQHSYISAKNLIRALGAEGMVSTMLRYLTVAENMLWQADSYQRSDMYDIVLHTLVKAKLIDKAIDVFRNMQLSGFPASVATYNIMIECCSLLKCFRSACGLVSMMLRHGFFPQKRTYTVLIKVLLAYEDFEGALNLLDHSRCERIEPDIEMYNTILREAYFKARVDIIEHIIQHIHENKIRPDPSTCSYTLSAYTDAGFHNTALEALHVLSLRMISEEDAVLQERRAVFEDLIHDEDPDTELRIIDIFSKSEEYIATALLNLRWCAIAGWSISWLPNESVWSRRLSSCYGTRTGQRESRAI